MFRTDKDLKLGSRRQGRSSRGSEGRDEVLEKARRERTQREKARASRGQAVSIQSWFRGQSAAGAARGSERADWDRKMSDFGKLQQTLVARGIPFTPPVKFVLMALQQLLFFYRREQQDSARLCLFCESVLTLCVLQADPSLNPAAHLAGIVAEPTSAAERGTTATSADPALRLRLRRLLAVCLDHTERELNKGVSDGNSPLKILLMLTGSRGHVACPSGMPEPAMTSPAVEARAAVSRCCLELLVFRLGLFSALRNVLIGGPTERKAIASAGTTTQLKPPPGRQGAVVGSWELALTALDAVGSLSPAATVALAAAPLSRSPPPPSAAAAAVPLRASFVAEILSVPLLPSRLGVDGVNLLLKERAEAFFDCLRDYRMEMVAAAAYAASNGERGAKGRGKGAAAGASAAAGPGAEEGNRRSRGGAGGAGHWGAFHLPPPPVSCCSTEAFLLGNIVAMGTKISVEGGGGAGRGGGNNAGGPMTASAARRGQREFMRAVTSLLEVQVRG
ncbi:unnamed protein product [Ectocarpus sp. 4 AP-2014]